MKIGIIGAGAMGSGIAQVVATAGNDVVLYDVNDIARQQAVENIRRSCQKLTERGKISFAQASATLARIRTTDRLDGLGGCQLVIEAILEDLDIKKSVFAELEMYVSDDAILATNTSSLSITAIAAACQRPERVVGIHFFNPATLMPLVEVILPLQAPPQYFLEKVVKIVENWGKTVVVARDTPGFIVNRIARPFYGEALRILEEGIADVATIDAAMRELGNFRMGPFELMDLIGHDVNYAVTESVWRNTYFDSRYQPSVTQKRLVEAGFLGQKAGRGFYIYPIQKTDNQLITNIELKQRIFDRILTMLINEAYAALSRQLATEQDIETAMRLGVNYPKGLLAWGKEIGLSEIARRIDVLFDTYREERYRCAPMLRSILKE
jgi:3-hydroxybutyryl-CoA dehydrogenase